MDILFENSYTRSKELAKEIYRYFYFQRKLYIFGYIILGLSFALNLSFAISGQSYNLAVFIFVPLVALLPLYCYIRQVSAMVKRDKEVHGKEIEVSTTVTNEFIQNTASTGAINKIEFCKIRCAVQTKNLILLRSEANLVYIFRKDSFTVGNKEDFISFLKNKGIKVSGK